MTARPRRRLTAVITAAAASLLLVGLGLARVSEAGFSATTDNPGDAWSSGTVILTDDDTGAAMFATATDGLLDGGSTQANCLTVTYNGTLTTDITVRVHSAATGTLAPYLDLTMEEGTGGGAGSCAGFAPERTLYSGTLSGFATTHDSFADGAGDWKPGSTGAAKVYRITTTVRNVPAAQNTAATATFTWEAAKVFTPAALDGTRLWLRGAALPAVGASVPTWVDTSAANRTITAVNTAPVVTDGPGVGTKAVRFNRTGYFALGDLGLAGGPGEVWAVIRDNGGWNGLWALGEYSSNGDESHYTYMGAVYEAAGLPTGRRVGFNPTLSTSAWRLYRVTAAGTASAPGAWTASLDGAVQATSTERTSWPAAAYLGQGFKNNGPDLGFNGDIADLIVRDRVSTPAEVAQITAFLNQEYGLTVPTS